MKGLSEMLNRDKGRSFVFRVSLSAVLPIAMFASCPSQAENIDYAKRFFPVGIYGEFSLDINKDYALSWSQAGLLLSYAYLERSYPIGAKMGSQESFDSVEKLNVQCVLSLLNDDFAKFLEVFKPAGYEIPNMSSTERIRGPFGVFKSALSGCSEVKVVGEVSSEGHRYFVVNAVGAKATSSLVIGYEEFKPGKWRLKDFVNPSQYAPIFVSALSGPRGESAGSGTAKIDEGITIALPKKRETIPAVEVLLRAQRANSTPVGRTAEKVLDAFLESVKAIPESGDQAALTSAWAQMEPSVTSLQLATLKERCGSMVARGDAPGACKAALLDHLRAWSSQRFVVDCGNMVFLLCLDDTVQSVGCLSLLKQADGHYRLCDTERTSDFPGLFYDDKFCRNLREKLLLIP